ncbi:hypothetical protein ACQP2Y_17540 [Actinoplanes sp. CA-051413]|uniref:hypothetical protein n=1 Tax=Actinoplanes sp. CA-051413 TaxID=3239899 RepID=UPI003D98A411
MRDAAGELPEDLHALTLMSLGLPAIPIAHGARELAVHAGLEPVMGVLDPHQLVLAFDFHAGLEPVPGVLDVNLFRRSIGSHPGLERNPSGPDLVVVRG